MKNLHIFSGLFIIGLLIQCGLAETKVRKERVQRQAYLPPSTQNVITEEIITIHEEGSPSGSSSHFDESNYGGGKYQIFEVHNHVDPSTGASGAAQSDFSASGYLPPEQEIRVQHVHQAQGANVNHLDVSSTSFADSQGFNQPRAPSSYQHANPDPNEEILRVEHIHINRGNVQQNSFSAPDYLPPHDDVSTAKSSSHFTGGHNSIHSHSTSYQQAYNQAQYAAPLSQGQQQQVRPSAAITKTTFKGPAPLPRVSQQASNYLPPHASHAHQQIPHPTQFKGPDYLPPHQTSYHQQSQQQVQQSGSDFSTQHNEVQQAHHNENYQQFQQSGQFKGPDYLPPHQHDHQQVQQIGQFKGQDYLPPHHEEQHPRQFNGPDYLPPHHQIGSQQHTHQHVDQHTQFGGQQVQHNEIHQQNQQPAQFKGADYLPPHQNNEISQQSHYQQVQQSNQFKGPDYLPPHQQHIQNNEIQQQVQQQNTFNGPDYLPPHQSQQPNYQQTQSPQSAQYHSVSQSAAFKGPDYLPPHQSNSQPGTLPSGYDFRKPIGEDILPQQEQQFQQPFPQPQIATNPTGLPAGYDFEKPQNAEEAIAELHTLPKDDNQEFAVQSQLQVGSDEQQIATGHQEINSFQANGYLPPHNAPQQTTQNNYHAQPANTLNQVSPQIFSPTAATAVAQAPVQNYLPPARPVQAEQYASNLHSLSSFMSNVQPNVRYGVTQFSAPRQPFREYGPPPPPANGAFAANGGATTQQRQQQQSVVLPVAPMYNDHASRAPYYAPAMSYATNTLANSYTSHTTAAHQQSGYQYQQQQHVSFNQQTKQNLQQFMPQDVRQSNPKPIPSTVSVAAPVPRHAITHTAPAVPVRQSTSSRVRTVQILNQKAVKTLKVLETSDQAGVKTIKILGPSSQQPSGEHRIVKVVTQTANSPHEHVQTVKIYDDHEDAPIGGRNAYLPPATRVIRQSTTKQKQLKTFTGRRRYR